MRRAPGAGTAAARPWAHHANHQRLTALEVASGVVLGAEPEALAPPAGADAARTKAVTSGLRGPFGEGAPAAWRAEAAYGEARRVLERIAVELLARPPCVVAFSGGRDSSALLAVLTVVARREGLEEPVAATVRFPDPASDEREWQERVVTLLGVRSWHVLGPGIDLDLLGEEARRVLLRHGLCWPAPAYAMAPLLRLARGGTLVSGEGGDEVLGVWRYARCWPRRGLSLAPRALGVLAAGWLPRAVRGPLLRWREPPYQSWLLPVAMAQYRAALGADLAGEPVVYRRYVAALARRRSTRLMLDSLARLAAGEGSAYAAPLLDGEFLGAMGAAGGVRGPGPRSLAMSRLFADVLPPDVVQRCSKATFGGAFFGEASRAFAAGWTGRSLAPGVVDEDLLRAAWLADVPVYGCALALQAAWLSGERSPTPRGNHPAPSPL